MLIGGIDMTKQEPDWSKAPEGATHFDLEDDYNPWLRLGDDGWSVWVDNVWISDGGPQKCVKRPKEPREVRENLQWDESIRGPRMSGTSGNRIWKYQMPVAEKFEMQLPKGAEILRMAGENGYLWLWAEIGRAHV